MIILRDKFFADNKEVNVQELAEKAYKRAELLRKANNANIKIKAAVNRVSLPKDVIERYKKIYLRPDEINKEEFVQNFVDNYQPESQEEGGNYTHMAIDKLGEALKTVSRPLQGVGKSIKQISKDGKILENTLNGAVDIADVACPSSTTIKVVTGQLPVSGIIKNVAKGYIPGGRAIIKHGRNIVKALDKHVVAPVEKGVDYVPGVGTVIQKGTEYLGRGIEGLGDGWEAGVDYVTGALKDSVGNNNNNKDKKKD